jgi:flagellin-like hook-associated protein FlgL
MLITTDLSTDTSPASRLHRAEAGTAASQPLATMSDGSAASTIDPSLQRLTDLPAGAPEAEWEIQDPAGAAQAVELARQDMARQPGSALAAQAGQLPQNVMSLLQPAD